VLAKDVPGVMKILGVNMSEQEGTHPLIQSSNLWETEHKN